MIKIEVDKRSQQAFERALRRKQSQLTDKQFEVKTLEKGAKPVEAKAKSLVKVKTGALRDSIRTEVEGEEVRILTDKEYAASEEYLGRPYMRPAAKELTQSEKIIAREYKKQAEKK